MRKSVFVLRVECRVLYLARFSLPFYERVLPMFWDLPVPPWFPIYLSLKVAGLATLVALISGLAVARFQMLLAKILPHSFVMSYWMHQQKLK